MSSITSTTPKNLKVLAVPVAFNEEKKIGSVLDRFTEGLVDEILVIDDASTDSTPEIVKQRGANLISHSSQKGVGAAIRTAIKYASDKGFDVIVILAGNDKDRPSEIPKLLEPISQEGYDFVQGSRYLPGGIYGNMPFYRRIATKIHPLLFSIATGKWVTDSTNGFRAIRLSIFSDKQINIDQSWLDKYELEPYIMYKAIRLGYSFKEVPVTKIYPPKELGYTKMKPIIGWWSILRPIFLLAMRIKK
ncbi:MAG: glycosyltransferase family 2 protein [Acidobacteria bacterium]|nr:glycosyltransferase family 2 protein [Acidobacteriota bacterium]